MSTRFVWERGGDHPRMAGMVTLTIVRRMLVLFLAALLLPACHEDPLTLAVPPPVPGPPTIGVSTASLFFTAPTGGPAPADQTLIVGNIGGTPSTLNWTATVDSPWLSVAPAAGTLTAAQSSALTVSITTPLQAESWVGPTAAAGALSPRAGIRGVWTGTEILFWGGASTNTGKRYDPVTDTWGAALSTVGAPVGRQLHAAVWTGTEMIVWGGKQVTTALNSGGRYNPATDSWTPMSTVGAPSARWAVTGVWTGSVMIVWGGDGGGFSYTNTGGIYDPATDTWVGTPTTTGAPSARAHHAAVWDGSRMIIWGGENPGKFNNGAFYDPGLDQWTGVTSTANAPSPRSHVGYTWTGREMVVWGGGDGGPHFNTGGRYNPVLDTWNSMTTVGAPSGRASAGVVAASSRLIVWGGEENGPAIDTGGIYEWPDPIPGTYSGTITLTDPGATNSPVQVQVGFQVTP